MQGKKDPKTKKPMLTLVPVPWASTYSTSPGLIPHSLYREPTSCCCISPDGNVTPRTKTIINSSPPAEASCCDSAPFKRLELQKKATFFFSRLCNKHRQPLGPFGIRAKEPETELNQWLRAPQEDTSQQNMLCLWWATLVRLSISRSERNRTVAEKEPSSHSICISIIWSDIPWGRLC